jgi:ribosomal protein S18 acetylase RimI-like enzyme
MNSSPAAPVDDGLTFYVAARLHARRFDRSVLSSMFLLNAADQLLTDSAGGVLALTDLGRSRRRAATLAAMFVGGLAVAAWAGLRGMLLLCAAMVTALLVFLVVVAPRAVRSVQAARFHGVIDEAWLVTDVATKPGHGVGDRLVGRACGLADDSGVVMVLSVAASNRSAVRLYERHGFTIANSNAARTQMARAPGSSTSRPSGVG